MTGVKPKAMRGTLKLLVPALLAVLVIVIGGSCGDRGNPRYAAEKKLFKARKVRDDLAAGGVRQEFAQKAIDGYRSIVSEYSGMAGRVEGMDEIVVSAQMDLAELEFRAGMLRESRGDFEKAIEFAGDVPAARANALYSAAFISEELGEQARALDLYGRFFKEFLGEGSLMGTAAMNPRYLVTPLKLSAIAASLGNGEAAAEWLAEAERTYLYLIGREKNEALLKETRFNLLTTYLQEKSWNKGLDLAADIEKRYESAEDAPSIRFIEAKIHEEGLRNSPRALAIYLGIAETYPESREAPRALLAAAAINAKTGNNAESERLYRRVTERYKDRTAEAVEASWQLARMAELRGEWDEASLRYKSIYTEYPETLQGFEAPLRVANSYRDKGEEEAARAAYRQALDHYDRLASGERPMSTKIMAEQYAVRALVEQRLWNEAIERLLRLPDRYPDYTPFRENCIRAAVICEKELTDTKRAIEILAACAARYPGTEFADQATEELKRLRGGDR